MIVGKDLQVDALGESLFEKVSFIIRSGERIGVLGPSPSLVTTFLRMIAGEIEMDEGTLSTDGERVAYVSPEVLFGETDSLAQVHHGRPTFLLIDAGEASPSAAAVGESIRFITGFRGGILIASSDASLMRAAKITRMFEMNASTKTVTSYTGSYDTYLVEKEKNDVRANAAYEKQQREKRRLEGWLEQKRKEASVDRSPEKGATIRAKVKYLQREILDKEIPKPTQSE